MSNFKFISRRLPGSSETLREEFARLKLDHISESSTALVFKEEKQNYHAFTYDDNREMLVLQSVVRNELRAIERICHRVLQLAQNSCYVSIHDCFFKQGSHFGLTALVKTLVRETNLRVQDVGGDPESTGIVVAIIAVEYIERVSQNVSLQYVQAFFLTAFILAFKLLDDDCLPNSFFGSLGGFSLKDVNDMESEFCDMLGWNFGISVRTYLYHRNRLLLC